MSRDEMAKIDRRNYVKSNDEENSVGLVKPIYGDVPGRIIGTVAGVTLCSSLSIVNPIALFVCRALISNIGGALGDVIETDHYLSYNHYEYFHQLLQSDEEINHY